MKQLRLAAPLCMALAFAPLGACAQTSAIAASITSSIPAVGAVCKNTVVDEQGWARTLQVYTRVNAAYLAGLKSDLWPKAVVAKVRPIRLLAPPVREAGTKALEACNATVLGAQITALTGIIDDIRAVAPGLPQ